MKNKRFKSALSLLLVLLLCFSVMAPSFAAQTVDLAATGDGPYEVEWHANSGNTPSATVGSSHVEAIFRELGFDSAKYYGIKKASAITFTNVSNNNTTNVNEGAYTICRTSSAIAGFPRWSSGTQQDITVKLYYNANFGVSGSDAGEIYLDGNKVSGEVKLYPGTEYTVTAKPVEGYTCSISGATEGEAFNPTSDMTITAVYTPDAHASVSLNVTTGDGTAQVLVNGEDAHGAVPVGGFFSVKTTPNTDRGYALDNIVVTQNGTEIEANNGVYGPAENGDEFVVSVTFKFDPKRVDIAVDVNKGTVSRSDIIGFFSGSYSYYGIAEEANGSVENLYDLGVYEHSFKVTDGEYFIYATNDNNGALIAQPVWDNAKVMLLRVRTYYTGTFNVTGSDDGEVYLNNEAVTGSVNLYTDTEYTVTAKDVEEYTYTITGAEAGTAFTPSADINVTVSYLKTAFATYELIAGNGGTAQVLVNGEPAGERISEGDSFTVTATPDLLHEREAITVTKGNETVTPNDNGEYGPVADGEVYVISVTFKTPDPNDDTKIERDVKSATVNRADVAGFFDESPISLTNYAIAPADDPTEATALVVNSYSVTAGRYIVYKGSVSNPTAVKYVTVRTYASVTFAVTGCEDGEIQLNGTAVTGIQNLYTDTEYTVTAKAVTDYEYEIDGADNGVAFIPDADTPAAITATYTKNKFATYTLSAGEGGTAQVLVNGEPAGDRISEGDSFTVTATANENAGYKLDNIVVTENDTEIEPNGDGSYGPAVDQAVYAITVSFTYDPPRAEIDVDANKGTVSRSDISGFFNDSYSYYGIAKEANDIEYLYNLLGYEYPFSVKDGEYFIYATNDNTGGLLPQPVWDNAKLMILTVKTYYTVTWKNWDKSVLASDRVYNGATPSYSGETPVRPEDMNATYTFSAWDDGTTTYLIGVDDLPPVTGDITYTAVYTADIKDLFVAHSITLGGDIGVNFYIDSNVAGVADAQTAVVKFAWDGGNYIKEVNLKELTPDEKGWLKATVNVVAAQMAHTIEAVAYINGEMIYTADLYSVQEYAEAVYDEPEKYDDKGKPEQLKALAAAMLHYGSEAQTVFADALTVKPDRADSVIANDPANYTGVTADAVAAKINGEASDLNDVATQLGAKYYTNSLIYLQNNTLRVYFTPNEYGQAMPNADAYAGSQSDYYYYAEKTNIPAAQLDNQQEFTVGDVNFYFSPLDYVKAVLSSSKMTEAQKNLAASLFLYNQKANAYFD